LLYVAILAILKADHGYSLTSRVILDIVEMMTKFDLHERRAFLQFITGSPRLPFGGWRSLQPPLTVVCKTVGASESPDDYLPSVMTCVNYLKVPNYSDASVLKVKFMQAIAEGQGSFHLS
jgi:E3 ubiquitin-protein ligase TRIP12